MGERAKIEYNSTGEVTADIKINGVLTRVSSFIFEHDLDGCPVAIVELVDPDVHITTLDSILIKKGGSNDRDRRTHATEKGNRTEDT